MKVIVSFNRKASPAEKQAGLAALRKQGFREAEDQGELQAFGTSIGEIPDSAFEESRSLVSQNKIPGIASLEPDEQREQLNS